jgi:2-succinyl-5-enolpyruvyl-6-hydroxy-3-cyclohexene-1-carboxylate synthase
MMISDKKSVQYIISFLKQKGILDVVLCPGSRNAPFILSFTEDSHFQITSYFDEKVAAFMALGIAKNKQKPVVLVCTSGSALLNFAPAIVEAYYQNIPLWILTADRPKGWEGKGENQTIHQFEIYKNYIQLSLEMEENLTFEEAQRIMNIVVQNPSNGPIHINFPFSEPLYSMEKEVLYTFDFEKIIETPITYPNIPFEAKIAIYVSEFLPDKSLNKALETLSQRDDVILFSEINSNCYATSNFTRIDALLNGEIPMEFLPDILITIGGTMLSKRARNFFKKMPQLTHIDIASYPRRWDNLSNHSFFIFSEKIAENIEKLLTNKDSCIGKEFKLFWEKREETSQNAIKSYIESISYSEYKICNHIIQLAPKKSVIFWGNSSAIRYANWSLWQDREDLVHITNRGTSGIEGVLATAIGWKKANPKEHVICVLGDVSALYEVNAFLAMNEIESMTVIVLNNFGGKIFDNIHPQFSEKAWQAIATPHQHSFETIAQLSNAAYHSFNTWHQAEFEKIIANSTKTLIEFQFHENTHLDWKEIMGK